MKHFCFLFALSAFFFFAKCLSATAQPPGEGGSHTSYHYYPGQQHDVYQPASDTSSKNAQKTNATKVSKESDAAAVLLFIGMMAVLVGGSGSDAKSSSSNHTKSCYMCHGKGKIYTRESQVGPAPNYTVTYLNYTPICHICNGTGKTE